MKAIEVEELGYTYPDGTEALKGISFSVEENETLCLVGPNGAGKTTLLLGLAGLLGTNGSVRVLGKKFERKNRSEIRRHLGLLFQDPDDQLFMPRIYEDIAFGPRNLGLSPPDIEVRVKDALGKVGLSGFEERASHHLSFGERKRASLATVLALKPKILLLDEPTANLDPRSRREFLRLTREIEATRIIGGHDLEMAAEIADRVLLLNRGEAVMTGAAQDILGDEELMEKNYLEVPLSLYPKR